MDHSKQDQQGESNDVNIDINGPADTSSSQQVGSSNMKIRDDQPRVGLSKEELMKYANEPFWVRARNILFATFWIVWASILVAAISYVVHSPGCQVASSG